MSPVQPPVSPPQLSMEAPSTTQPAPLPESSPESRPGDHGDQADAGRMPLMDHLRELRIRILRALLAVLAGFCLCYWQAPRLQAALEAPLLKALQTLPEVTGKLMFTGLAEAFIVEVKVALAAGFLAAAPFVFYQFWAFMAPGLYPRERRLLIPLALATGLFFVAGSCFGYFVVFPPAFDFFLSYNSDTVTAMPALAEYFGFCIQLLLAFGLVFELPVLAFFLARFGLINAGMLKKARGYAYIAAFIIAAVLTPPDVVSQLLMAGPLLLLYEISICVVRVCGRERAVKNSEDKSEEGRKDEKSSET